MGFQISDHDSAAACLVWVRELAGRLDLDHPDPAYQAGKAEQLARAAKDLAHDLRVLAEGQRLRRHLVDVHGRVELADRTQNADVWASDHHDDHRAGVPVGTPHGHDDHEGSIHEP
jgi:hypothetical protein